MHVCESVEILSASKLNLEVPHTDRKTDNNNIMTKVQHEQTRLTVGWLYSYVRVMSGHSLRDRNQKLPITISIVCSSVLVFSIIAQCWW